MYYKQTIEESNRIVEGIKLIAPDINIGDYKLSDLEAKIIEGESHAVYMENLRGQVSAGVATSYTIESDMREINNAMVHGIRASKHSKRDELLRFFGYKLPWEFGSDTSAVIILPPSGQSPAAA